MSQAPLAMERPERLQATEPPEARGLARDEVRLLVSRGEEHSHAAFRDLPAVLRPGDLLVVNESATLPASLPATGTPGEFVVNLSTDYGGGLWLAEPRWRADRPGPLPLGEGERFRVAGAAATMVMPYPGLPRLWFIQLEGAVEPLFDCCGRPVRYGYLEGEVPLAAFQTVFARVPGSAEMPSAGRPFSKRVLAGLGQRGAALARLVLHTGVSSIELDDMDAGRITLFPEPFEVPAPTARAINSARASGGRIIAVGTTVVRALESAWDGDQVRPARGFTRLFVHPGRPPAAVDGLLTGLHDPTSTHLAMIQAVGGSRAVETAYAEAVREGYLWHEFGDSHLLLPV